MTLSIKDIMNYGCWYRHESTVDWWFCLTDGRIYETEDLFNEFGYKTKQEIEESELYILLFKTDMIAAEKHFLNERGIRNFDGLPDSEFAIEFRKVLDMDFILCLQWGDFEDSVLKRDAVKWCRENHIPFLY